MWWSCFDYYVQEHIHNCTIKRLRLRDHLQKDRSQKTAHICSTLIKVCIIDSLFTRWTHRGSLPQKQSITGPPLDGDTAVHGPAAFGARIRSCFANQIGIKWEKTGDNGMHFPGADLVSMARVARECRVFSSECGQNIPVLPVGLRKVEMYRFCGNNNEESF